MKTIELTGAALDWAVAKCEGYEPFNDSVSWLIEHDGRYVDLPRYSTNWAQGGPIIEREKIGLLPSGNAYYERNGGTYYSYGPTPLIAAMRCYCASKLGDTVEIPEELR